MKKIMAISIVMIVLVGIFLLVFRNREIDILDTKLLWVVYDMNIKDLEII